MKKSIFTAIAIMAFVGTTLGNTKEVEKEVLLNDEVNITFKVETKSTLLQPAYSQCVLAAAAAYGRLVGTLGEDAAMDVALAVEEACEEARTC